MGRVGDGHDDEAVARLLSRQDFLKAMAAAGIGAAAGPALLAPQASAQRLRRGRVSDVVMREIYEEVKTPFKYGVVIPRPAGSGNVDSPSVFRYDGRWYMLYVTYREAGDGYETFLATSRDLLDWRTIGNVLPFRTGAWDATQAAGYTSLQDPEWGGSNRLERHDGRYWLTYIGGDATGYEAGELSIGVASTDSPGRPVEWDRAGAPVLRPTDPDARRFERSKLFKSTVIRDPEARLGAEFVMYYNATYDPDFNHEAIGMAVSDDMRTWRRYRSRPVVTPYSQRGLAVIGDPQVVRIGDVWVMFFWNAIEFAPNGIFDSFAVSYDLVNWQKWTGPALISSTEPYDVKEAHKPWVIKHDGVVYHFYSGIDEGGHWSIALATSKDLRDRLPREIRASASHTYVDDNPQDAVDGVGAADKRRDNRWTARDSPNDVDWLQFDFDSRRAVSGVTIDFISSGKGLRPPRGYEVEYLRGTRWVRVRGTSRTPEAPDAGANVISFDRVRTRALRIYVEHRGGGYFTRGEGIYTGVSEVDFIA